MTFEKLHLSRLNFCDLRYFLNREESFFALPLSILNSLASLHFGILAKGKPLPLGRNLLGESLTLKSFGVQKKNRNVRNRTTYLQGGKSCFDSCLAEMFH
jgi:hypothetical protein